MKKYILGIDPANVQSAYVLLDTDFKLYDKGKIPNEEMLLKIDEIKKEYKNVTLAIEMIASYGMAVGKTTFETCLWIGRFIERFTPLEYELVYRKDVKMNLCYSMRAKDSNIRQALIDRFGVVGTKKNQGYFYGFKSDIWQSHAVAVTYIDKLKEERETKYDRKTT